MVNKMEIEQEKLMMEIKCYNLASIWWLWLKFDVSIPYSPIYIVC